MITKLDKKFRILNTRPASQTNKLRLQLNSYPNCESVELSLLEIVPINFKLWHQQCLSNKPDLLIFISANAVHNSIENLKQCWQQMPEIAAIGSATNLALQKYNISADIIPNEANSHSLIKHPSIQIMTNKTVMIIKGQGGQKILQKYFQSRQTKLIELDVYYRKCPKNLDLKIKQIWQQAPINIILIYSIESMTNLLNNAKKDIKLIIKNTPCLVISERIRQQAQKYGIKDVRVFSTLNINKALQVMLRK